MLDYIPDGYEEDAYIAARPQMHGEFRFRYRPALVAERTVILEKQRGEPANKQDHIAGDVLSKKLVNWSLKDKQGNPAPLSTTNIMRLKPSLFTRIWGIVLGVDQGDPDPQATAQQGKDEADLAFDAMLAGTSVSQIREDHDAKNSETV